MNIKSIPHTGMTISALAVPTLWLMAYLSESNTTAFLWASIAAIAILLLVKFATNFKQVSSQFGTLKGSTIIALGALKRLTLSSGLVMATAMLVAVVTLAFVNTTCALGLESVCAP